ncbi:MAG TPA: extracellular solute-binding protein [bacterium]|nr:extracellular solute-binding protein [bacterium]
MTGKQERVQSRRAFLSLAAVSAAGLVGSSCARSGGVTARKQTAVSLRHEVPLGESVERTVEQFNTSRDDIHVTMQFLNGDLDWEYHVKHLQALPFWYTAGGPADIYYGRSTGWAHAADAGLIIPLDDYLDSSTALKRDDFHRSRYGKALDTGTYRGKLWGIPLIADTYGLFCNRDLFRAAGLERLPATWEETLSFAQQMTRDTNGDGTLDRFGYQQCSFQYPLQVIGMGLPFIDMQNKRVLLDSDLGVESLDLYRRLLAFSPPHADFERGDTGMKMSTPDGTYGMYSHLNYEVAPVPAGRIHVNTYGHSDAAYGFCISAESDKSRQDAAWKIIEYLMTEEVYFDTVEEIQHLPIRNSIRTGERFDAYLKKHPHLRTFVEEYEWAVARPCVPEYRYLESVMRNVLLPVQEKGGSSLTKDQLREILKRESARINERLARATW